LWLTPLRLTPLWLTPPRLTQTTPARRPETDL
jgi:hypothetical protein